MTDDMLEDKDAYMRTMMSEFHLPKEDALIECVLTPELGQTLSWHAGIFLTTRQEEKFYNDPFQFWVRALYCFAENIREGDLFSVFHPIIHCQKITPAEFLDNLKSLWNQSNPDETFCEHQNYSQTRIDFIHREFSNAYQVAEGPGIKSLLALTDQQYMAIFMVPRDR